MATIDNETTYRTYTAAGNIAANQYECMYVSDGVQQVNVASEPANYAIAGILANKPGAAGRHAQVATRGRFKWRAGGAIGSVQSMLTCNGSGRAALAASGNMVVGFALETAAGDGDLISVDLIQPVRLSGSGTR